MSCWGPDSLCGAQATDHRPHLLLRRQRQAKLLVSSKHLQDQLHLQVRLQRAFLRRCSELFRCSIWDKKKNEKSVVMESANWKQSTQNFNCEENAALTLSRFERTALKSIQAGFRCVLQAVKWGRFFYTQPWDRASNNSSQKLASVMCIFIGRDWPTLSAAVTPKLAPYPAAWGKATPTVCSPIRASLVSF